MSSSNTTNAPPSPSPNSATATATGTAASASASAPPSGAGTGGAGYYDKGNTDAAVATKLTIQKLEKRRKLTSQWTCSNDRLVLVIVGLPGRGKSFLCRKLQAFYKWRGDECQVFNVGKFRRSAACETMAQDASFFDSNNVEATRLREEVAMMALDGLLEWVSGRESSEGEQGGNNDDSERTTDTGMTSTSGTDCAVAGAATSDADEKQTSLADFGRARGVKFADEEHPERTEASTIPAAARTTTTTTTTTSAFSKNRTAIFDATNSTRARRQAILEHVTRFQRDHQQQQPTPIGLVFIESICDDEDLLLENFKYKITTSPDYKDMTEVEALQDLLNREQKYKERYETIDDDSQSYVKIYNFSSKVLSNQIYGGLSKLLVPALMAWHIGDRDIFFCRAGKATGHDNIDDSANDAAQAQAEQLLSALQGGVLPSTSSLVPPTPPRASILSQVSTASTPSYSSNGGSSSHGRARQRRSLAIHRQGLGIKGASFRNALSEFMKRELAKYMRVTMNASGGSGRSPMRGRRGSIGTSLTSHSIVSTMSDVTIDDGIIDDITSGSRRSSTESSASASMSQQQQTAFPCFVMTSTMPRAIQTIISPDGECTLPLLAPVRQVSALNPMDKGDFSGMDLDECREEDPEWFEEMEADPFHTRFPGGESYEDLVSRLETTVIDIEQQVTPVLVISHFHVVQVLLAYFLNIPVEECPFIKVPHNTVIQISPLRGGGWRETRHELIADDEDNDDDGEEESAIEESDGNGGGRDISFRTKAMWGMSVRPPSKV